MNPLNEARLHMGMYNSSRNFDFNGMAAGSGNILGGHKISMNVNQGVSWNTRIDRVSEKEPEMNIVFEKRTLFIKTRNLKNAQYGSLNVFTLSGLNAWLKRKQAGGACVFRNRVDAQDNKNIYLNEIKLFGVLNSITPTYDTLPMNNTSVRRNCNVVVQKCSSMVNYWAYSDIETLSHGMHLFFKTCYCIDGNDKKYNHVRVEPCVSYFSMLGSEQYRCKDEKKIVCEGTYWRVGRLHRIMSGYKSNRTRKSVLGLVNGMDYDHNQNSNFYPLAEVELGVR